MADRLVFAFGLHGWALRGRSRNLIALIRICDGAAEVNVASRGTTAAIATAFCGRWHCAHRDWYRSRRRSGVALIACTAI